MNLPLRWEFPGGKVEPGEGLEECLRRELVEEMGIRIAVGRPLTPATHDYPSFTVTLYPYVCSIISGEITLFEHSAISWLPAARMLELDWADADLPIIAEYLQGCHPRNPFPALPAELQVDQSELRLRT